MQYQNSIYTAMRQKMYRVLALVGIPAAVIAMVFNAIADFGLLSVLVHAVVIPVLLPLLFPKRRKLFNAFETVSFLYLCFVYTPLTWRLLDGILSAMPFVVFTFATFLVMLADRPLEKWILWLYLVVLASLLAWDIAVPRLTADISMVATNSFSFTVMLSSSIVIFTYFRKKFVGMSNKLYRLTLRDTLTSLYNMRYMRDTFDAWEDDYLDKHIPDYYIVMIDIDDFKRVNDVYGHQCGDEVICNMADMLTSSLPESYIIGRYGGDEFMVIAKDVDEQTLFQKFERFRLAVLERTHTSQNIRLSVSIGLGRRSLVASKDELFRYADRLMYLAKEQKEGDKYPERRICPREKKKDDATLGS